MQIIHPIVKPFDQLLGKQKLNEQLRYRLMTFVMQIPVSEGMLLYHTLTKALVSLDFEETCKFQKDPFLMPELVQLWFAVPNTHDDFLLNSQVVKIAHLISPPKKGITGYTILTTTDCNARCFYCYEKGLPRVVMTKETAKKSARYIIRHSEGNPVSLRWFGGEPLYNKPAITTICSILQEAGMEYHSRMVSNGYLIDTDTIKEAKELWNLKKIQITLDGTEKIYNRSKAYIYTNGNAFLRVMNNIHSLLESDIRVSIRLNIDFHNADDLFFLAKQLHHEFSDHRNLTVYSHALFGESLKNAAVNNPQKRRLIYKKQDELATLLRQLGLSKPSNLSDTIKLTNCMADNDHSISILPNGNIGKCEHFLNDHYIGHIDQDEFDSMEIQGFKKQFKDGRKICTKCSLYPECTVLKECPNHKHCYSEDCNATV